MQKIIAAEVAERKAERTRRLISMILLGILLLSSASYAFIFYQDYETTQPTDSTQTPDGRYQTTVGDKTFVFTHSPSTVASIPVTFYATPQSLVSAPLYVVSDSEAITAELSYTLGQFTRLIPACLGPCAFDLPEKTCVDNMIVWNQTETNRVYQEENCIMIEGDLRAVDAFLFKFLGIQ